MKMEQTECSETSAYKIQTPGNYPEENIHHPTYFPHMVMWACLQFVMFSPVDLLPPSVIMLDTYRCSNVKTDWRLWYKSRNT